MSFLVPDSLAPHHLDVSAKPRRRLGIAVLAVGLCIVMATLGVGIVLSQRSARSNILSNFGLRGRGAARFVSTFLYQQAARQQNTAHEFLSARNVSPQRFRVAVAAFGSHAAVLLDRSGRVIEVVPSDPSLIGKQIAGSYAHLIRAERGMVAVSGVVPSAVSRESVAAIAVPFGTSRGRRVFSAAYGVSGSTLSAFVDHTISYPQHNVYLVDQSNQLVSASPRTSVHHLSEADPALARSMREAKSGPVSGAKTPSTFTTAPVPGTEWKIVIAVPNSRLFASISGWTRVVPWLVFSMVAIFAALLLVLFARLSALSQRMASTARTDSLTGLANRRALSEHLVRAASQARRHRKPIAVLMIDLDRFKQTNDEFGHAAGDMVLRAVADCMRDVLRAEDVYGRWGGDEFVVLMTTNAEEMGTVANRLREAASEIQLPEIGLEEGVHMSIGMALAARTTPEKIVQEADIALYREKAARRAGRDAAQSLQQEEAVPGGAVVGIDRR